MMLARQSLAALRLTAAHRVKALPATLRMNSTAAAKPAPRFQAVLSADDFEDNLAKRPDFDHSNTPIQVTKSPDPTWSYGNGVRTPSAASSSTTVSSSTTPPSTPPSPNRPPHKEIDPYSPDRSVGQNYSLLISGIAPRPVGFLSTVSAAGKKNLAPFSYFQLVDHDPPTFVVGFSSRAGRAKDTFQNLQDTGECVINTVSENMIEAVNASSIDAPPGLSEWDVTGLHEAPAATVRPSRVEESVFSIEARVVDVKEFAPHAPGMSGGGIVLLKATRFWVREDAANEDFSHIELDKLRPVAQLGGMSYGRVSSTFELPRGRWAEEQPKSELLTELQRESEE